MNDVSYTTIPRQAAARFASPAPAASQLLARWQGALRADGPTGQGPC